MCFWVILVFVTIAWMGTTDDKRQLSDKLRTARDWHRPPITQEELATRLGIKRSTYANYETGRIKVTERVVATLADVFKIPVEWFYDERPGPPPPLSFPSPYGSVPGAAPPAPLMAREAQIAVGRRKFPLMGSAGASVFPLESADPDPDDFVEFSDELYRPGRFAIQVKGDSGGDVFQHGDYILVQPSKSVQPGLLAVARSQDYEFLIKEMVIENGRPILRPIADGYPDILPGDQWEVVGYAVGRRKERGYGRYLEEGDNAGMRAKHTPM